MTQRVKEIKLTPPFRKSADKLLNMILPKNWTGWYVKKSKGPQA